MVLPKKREREEDFNNITTNMANCLMLFSNPGHFDRDKMKYEPSTTSRVFECKTCNRQFSSFQALGGHRASHKKQRLSIGDLNNLQLFHDELPNYKPKSHKCSICGVEFAIRQALGGHMKRHRAIKHQVIKKKLNGGRILCLDLNLSPLENDLEVNLGKANHFV